MEHQTHEQSRGPQGPAVDRAGHDDDLLSVIAEVEHQLEALRAAQAGREELRIRLEKWEAELAARAEQTKAQGQALESERVRMQEERARFEQESAGFAQKREEAERALRELVEQQRRGSAEHESRLAEIQSAERLLAERKEQAAQRAAVLEKQEQQLAERLGELSQQENEHRAMAAELETVKAQVSELNTRIASAQEEAARQTQEADEARTSARAAAAELQLLRGQTRQVPSRSGETEALRKELNGAADAKAQLAAQLQEREARLTELTRALDDANARLQGASQAVDEREPLGVQVHSFKEELRNSEAQVQQLQEQLGSARDEARQWRARAEQVAGEMDTDVGHGMPKNLGQAVMRRWNRLRLMRSLIRDQHEKLRRAGETLRERHQEYEKVLAEREHLVRLRAALVEARRQMKEGETKQQPAIARMLMPVSLSVVAICGLLGLSWAISVQVAPATYVARATLAADSESGQAAPDQLAEWQRYHESLVSDAGMMQIAAERMTRHGIVSLGTPAQLSSRIQSDVLVQSPHDGLLIVELRGTGGSKTARELEVLTTAMASQANATRGRRPDGLGTVVAETASPGDAVSDSRIVYAGGIFGLGSGFAAFAGLALWRRMSAAKAKFEDDLRAANIAEEANWLEAPQVISRPRM